MKQIVSDSFIQVMSINLFLNCLKYISIQHIFFYHNVQLIMQSGRDINYFTLHSECRNSQELEFEL